MSITRCNVFQSVLLRGGRERDGKKIRLACIENFIVFIRRCCRCLCCCFPFKMTKKGIYGINETKSRISDSLVLAAADITFSCPSSSLQLRQSICADRPTGQVIESRHCGRVCYVVNRLGHSADKRQLIVVNVPAFLQL